MGWSHAFMHLSKIVELGFSVNFYAVEIIRISVTTLLQVSVYA